MVLADVDEPFALFIVRVLKCVTDYCLLKLWRLHADPVEQFLLNLAYGTIGAARDGKIRAIIEQWKLLSVYVSWVQRSNIDFVFGIKIFHHFALTCTYDYCEFVLGVVLFDYLRLWNVKLHIQHFQYQVNFFSLLHKWIQPFLWIK